VLGKKLPREADASSPWETIPGIGEGEGWEAEDEDCDIGQMKGCYGCVAVVKGGILLNNREELGWRAGGGSY
jgi:hypothetical protein